MKRSGIRGRERHEVMESPGFRCRYIRATRNLSDLEIVKLSDTHNKSRSGFNPTSNYQSTPAVGLKPDLHAQKR